MYTVLKMIFLQVPIIILYIHCTCEGVLKNRNLIKSKTIPKKKMSYKIVNIHTQINLSISHENSDTVALSTFKTHYDNITQVGVALKLENVIFP